MVGLRKRRADGPHGCFMVFSCRKLEGFFGEDLVTFGPLRALGLIFSLGPL